MLSTNHVCGKCHTWNNLDNNNLKEVNARDGEGKSYRLLCYNCNECGGLNIVQVDDDETLLISARLRRELIKSFDKSRKGLQVTAKESKKKQSLNDRLDKKRKKINEQIEDKTFYNKDGDIIK